MAQTTLKGEKMKIYIGILLLLTAPSALFGVEIRQEITVNNPQAQFTSVAFQGDNTVAITGQKNSTKAVQLYNSQTGELIESELLTPKNPKYNLYSPEKSIGTIKAPLEIQKKNKKIILYRIDHSPFFGKKLKGRVKTIALPTANVIFDAALSPNKKSLAIFYQNLDTNAAKIIIIQ